MFHSSLTSLLHTSLPHPSLSPSSTHHSLPFMQADTAKTQQLGSRIRQLELDLQVSELTKQQFEEEHKILVTDKGRLEALLVQKEHEMTRIHVTLEVS